MSGRAPSVFMSSKAPSSALSIPTWATTRLKGGGRRSTQHRAPAIILPLRIERQVDAYGDLGISLENINRLLIPRRRKHHGHRYGHSSRDETLERHVHAVAHSRIVRADDQVHRGRCT